MSVICKQQLCELTKASKSLGWAYCCYGMDFCSNPATKAHCPKNNLNLIIGVGLLLSWAGLQQQLHNSTLSQK